MRRIEAWIGGCVVLAGLAALAAPGLASGPPATAAEGEPPERSAKVEELLDRVTAGLGGAEAWEATRYLVFEFAGARSHWWDRFTGRHRLEGTTQDGAAYVVLQDVHDRGAVGSAWIGGEPVAGERAAELIENAYAAWVNDTYWLISPYKLRDPGVHLEHAGRETIDGVPYDKLHLTFGDVGLTPGDQYWMFIHPETGLVERWEYVLESQEPPPTAWEWLDWERYGPGIMLSSRRVREKDGRALTLGPIAVPDVIPDSVFSSPEPVGPDPDERPIER